MDYNPYMYDLFTHGEAVYCPDCPNEQLSVLVRNYSGCSVDFGRCPKCGKAWQISFKVDEIRREPRRDGPTRKEVEEEEQKQKQKADLAGKEERKKTYEKLKKEFDCNERK